MAPSGVSKLRQAGPLACCIPQTTTRRGGPQRGSGGNPESGRGRRDPQEKTRIQAVQRCREAGMVIVRDKAGKYGLWRPFASSSGERKSAIFTTKLRLGTC